MGKTAVIYRSKSGFTKTYAQWIAQETGAELYDAKGIKPSDLEKFDTIVYGGGLYAVGINGVKLITKNLNKLKNKKIIIFALGASSVREEIIEEVKNKNFTKKQQELIDFYMLRGGFDYSKIGLFDKFLMQLLKMQLKSKKELTADERGMLNSYNHPVDFRKRERIEPIVAAIME